MTSSRLPKEFWNFILARLFFVLGFRMISSIVMYQIFHLTNTYMVGIAGMCEFVPAVVSALYAGHYIDRHNKRNILIWSYAFYLICAASLGIVSMPQIQISGHARVIGILSIVFCTGIIRSFAGPTANSMLPMIVSRAQLPRAISFNSSTWLVSSIMGHAAGGMLIALGDAPGDTLANIYIAYFVTTALILTAGFFAASLKPKPPVTRVHTEPMVQAIRQGFKFVFSNKNLLGVLSLDLFAVLFGGAVAFIPEIAENVLHVKGIGYGFLNAAMDIGSLVSIGLLIWMPMKQKQGLKMILAVAAFGLCIIIFGLSKVFWLSFLALAVAGFFDGISVVVRGTIAQLNTPDELRGRVASINLIFINYSNELGQFESGLTSKWMSSVPAIIFGGAMSLAVVVGTWFKFPNLRKLEY
ncbi:MAG TPA: MFS transporter [Ferruginibacter sp.]|nr:MFS transporter [Ferruginibacter sp.]